LSGGLAVAKKLHLGDTFVVTKSQNTDTACQIINTNSGAAATASLQLTNNAGSCYIGIANTTGAVGYEAAKNRLYVDSFDRAGLSLVTRSTGDIRFYTAGPATANERGRISNAGGFSWGSTTDPGARNVLFGGTLSVTGASTLTGGIVGGTDASNATAGHVGEYPSSSVPIGSAVSLTTATSANVTSISLTAGDWDVSGNINYTAGTATVTGKISGISTTSATLPTDGSEVYSGVQLTLGTATDGSAVPRKRISVSGTTTVYLVGQATFSAGTVTAFGSITARRIR
jgi:hypothetical protein